MNLTRRLILSAAKDNNDKKVDYTGTQEVDISVGLPYGSLFRSASVVGDAFAGFNFISPSDIVTGENKTVLPTFRAEYGYNVLSWLSLGAGVNYSYGSYRMLYKEDNSHAWDEWTHLATATFKGKFIKIKYITQLPTACPSFAFFCNLPQYIGDSYKRYLENKLRSHFDFTGCPIRIFMRRK